MGLGIRDVGLQGFRGNYKVGVRGEDLLLGKGETAFLAGAWQQPVAVALLVPENNSPCRGFRV